MAATNTPAATAPNRATTISRMPLVEALTVLRDLRREEVVITTMGTAREWPKLSTSPLDLHYVPSAMGEAPALGLGIALAQPSRHVIVLNGDGCMMMNLGSLATIIASGATNLSLIVFENGIYEVTGGQKTVAAVAALDFCGMARAAGFTSVSTFDDLSHWKQQAAAALAQPGPRFILLRTEPERDRYHLDSPGPIAPRLATLRQALGI